MSVAGLFSNVDQLQAANTIAGGIQQGEAQALPEYTAGINTLTGYGQSALAPLTQNFGTLTGGATQLGNLLGLGGQAGTNTALQTLQTMPGYQASLGAANAGSAAAQAASGGTGSGNAIIQGQNVAQNVAGQNYNNYVQQLQPYLSGLQNVGGQIANTATNIGSGVNSAYQNVGNMFYGGATSAANALAAAQANTSGASNLLNLGMSGIAGLGGYLLAGSDIKFKEDIQPVGALASGETVYRYRYKGDPRTQIGLIAQELEETTPESVFELMPDLRWVDYRRATDKAAKILEFSRQPYEPPPMHRPFASELMELAA